MENTNFTQQAPTSTARKLKETIEEAFYQDEFEFNSNSVSPYMPPSSRRGNNKGGKEKSP